MGYVYAMRNKSFKDGILKIGFTHDNLEERAQQLYNTGVPTPFNIVFKEALDDYKELEKYLHSRLDDKRINPAREFFNTSIKEIEEIIKDYKEEEKEIIINSKTKEIKGIPLVKILPHQREIFRSKQLLYEYFLDKIKHNREEYYLAKNLKAEKGTILWIAYGTEIIGEVKMLRETVEIERDNNFNKELKIDPKTIVLYSSPISYYDYFDLQGKKPYFATYHNVSY